MLIASNCPAPARVVSASNSGSASSQQFVFGSKKNTAAKNTGTMMSKAKSKRELNFIFLAPLTDKSPIFRANMESSSQCQGCSMNAMDQDHVRQKLAF